MVLDIWLCKTMFEHQIAYDHYNQLHVAIHSSFPSACYLNSKSICAMNRFQALVDIMLSHDAYNTQRITTRDTITVINQCI